MGGVTVLQGHAKRYWSLRTPDAAVPVHKAEAQAFTAIPFYVNTNREPTHMAVWIAEDAKYAVPATTEGDAIPTASHYNASDTVWALNNGREPKALDDDDTIPRLTWWDHRGTSEWAQYAFPKVQEVRGVEVYWWDETRTKHDCRVPASWELQYKKGEQWLPVTSGSGYGTSMDTFNRVTFDSVHTDGLRLAVTLQEGWSAGVLQWRVLV